MTTNGTEWAAGQKITIADYLVAAILFSYVWNDALPGGADFTGKAQAIVAANETFSKYADRLKHELADYLAARPLAPI